MPSTRIIEFDTWRPGYGLASVRVLRAGTSDLADVFSDEDLTVSVTNPLTLNERIIEGISYGRFAAPVYVGVAYELEINSVDHTGVTRPALTTLDAQDASLATVKVSGGEENIALEDHLARRIDVENFGVFLAVGASGASASTNNATLVAAIGVGGARGGGYVDLPAGTYQVTNFTLPEGVVLRGQDRDATILQSTIADQVIVIGGDRAGFERLTLDGVSQVTNSIGVYAENKNEIVFDDVTVKRFDTAVYRKGGKSCNWRELTLSDCLVGLKPHGDAANGLGGAHEFNRWTGGKVELCSIVGIIPINISDPCRNDTYCGIHFEDNTGIAVHIEGARAQSFIDCDFSGNTRTIVVEDATPTSTDNTVIGLEIVGGSITDGTLEFTGTLENVALRGVTLDTVAVTLTTPTHNILVEDCHENGVTLAGVATAWTRRKTTDQGASSGLTTGNAATKAWGLELDHGQRVYLEGKVIGRQRDGGNDGFYHIAVSARRANASLAYDTQTSNFTVGDIITGATSRATARITADGDSGATGNLDLQDVVGTFVDNEIITGAIGGSATVNGSLGTGSAALAGAVTAIRTAQESTSAWDATFVANGPEIELRVTGNTSQTVEWVVDVTVVSS